MITKNEKNDNGSGSATLLYLHTLETLCKELVSGRAVIVDEEGDEFRLTSSESRSILNWYWNNRTKWARWAQRNMKQDVEAAADQVDKKPPNFAPTELRKEEEKKDRIYLKKLRAHRFAGIHRYGTPEAAPEDFEFDFEKGLTLIEGENGAGKTSLVNAVCWCLTGYVYRTQRPPEKVEEAVLIRIREEGEIGSGEHATYDITSITPIPSAEVINGLEEGTPIHLDTSVELSFVDDKDNEIGSIKRSVERGRRGNIRVTAPDFSVLDLDPIGREVGTKMPGLIPYIQLGSACEMGAAVAELTGIKPLEDLVIHARKSKEKLKKDLVDDRKLEIDIFDGEFSKIRTELASLIKDNPGIEPTVELAKHSDNKVCEKLESLSQHFEKLQGEALAESTSILGKSFDHSDPDSRDDLIENVGPALGLLDAENLSRLSSASRLSNLRNLSEKQLSDAEAMIQKLICEANEVAKLAKNVGVAARVRLYVRVANWIREHKAEPYNVEDCPVCETEIKDKTDAVTGEKVKDHIKRCLESQSDYLEKTVMSWEKSAVEILVVGLPDSLSSEINNELPEKPGDLILKALVEELFESPRFEKSLAPLKEAAQILCSEAVTDLSEFKEPVIDRLPDCFDDCDGGIKKTISLIMRAIAFARWRRLNDKGCREAFEKTIGKSEIGEPGLEPTKIPIEQWSIRKRLGVLDRIVRNTSPITEALSKVAAMSDKIAERKKKEDRIELYGRAAYAFDELLELRKLVELQVGFLIGTLSSRTEEWKKHLYKASFRDAPKVVKTDVGSDGSLAFEAETQGSRAAVQHISNASDLRATLLGFLLAFWEHLLNEQGGLALLLLDDLQELFDPYNRRRIANNITNMVEGGGQVIITTNDHAFGRRAANSAYERIGYNRVDHRCIHALRASREHIELGYFIEEIEKKRKDFEEKENDHQTARDYIKQLRIYIENRLIDLFDVSDSGLPKKPTLSDLMNAVRTRISAGNEPFTSKVFQKLVDDSALKEGSEFFDLMNQSHHSGEDQIMYTDVWEVKDVCIHVRKLVKAVYEEYERWLRRDPQVIIQDMPAIPGAFTALTLSVPIFENLAAFTSDDGLGEPIESGDQFFSTMLDNHAIYIINTHNFGFSVWINCRVIVDLGDEEVLDRNLVIALHKEKVYARRLLRDDSNPHLIALGSEAENPLKRPPSLLLPTEEVRLLRVVGVLFDDRPYYPRPTDEAVLETSFGAIEDIKIVFRVRKNDVSALPLAIGGQSILGGICLTPSQLAEKEGCAVAIATTEGTALKRIGRAVTGAPHVRLFESIGGLGASMLVRTEDVEDFFGKLPVLQSAREVLGVLYEIN